MSDIPGLEQLEQEIIPPRPRGRARKNGADTGPDPSILTGADDPAGPGAKAAGRKPGSRQSKAEKIEKWAIDIMGAHELAAVMLQMPALRITEDQAKAIAGPAFETADKYGWGGGVGPELRLLFVMGSVYGPMAFQVQMELHRRRADAARPAEAATASAEAAPGTEARGDANVFQFGAGAAGDGSIY